MKAIICGLLILAGLSAHAADEQSDFLLSSDELLSLTPSEQIQYIKEVRTVITDVTQRVDFYSEADEANSRMPAAAAAESPEAHYVHDLQTGYGTQYTQWLGKEEDFLKAAQADKPTADTTIKAKNAADWLLIERAFLNQIPDSNKEKAELKKTIDERVAFFKTNQKLFTDKLGIKSFYPSIDKIISGKSDVCTENLIPDNKLYAVGEKDPFPAIDKNACIDQKNYRCMYAGFVIKGKACKGMQKLPDGITLGLKDVTCPDKKPVMCNPILFGLEFPKDKDNKNICTLKKDMKKKQKEECVAQASPICLPASKSATSDCQTQSNKQDNLNSTIELIKMNPGVWDAYNSDLAGLCNKDMYNSIYTTASEKAQKHMKADIDSTCAAAKLRLADINKTMGPPEGKKSAAKAKDKTKAPAEDPLKNRWGGRGSGLPSGSTDNSNK